jgi:hypothetical protein
MPHIIDEALERLYLGQMVFDLLILSEEDITELAIVVLLLI